MVRVMRCQTWAWQRSFGFRSLDWPAFGGFAPGGRRGRFVNFGS